MSRVEPSMYRAALAVTILAITGSAQSRPNEQAQIGGVYHSNYDDVTLTRKGDRITGTYVCCDGGTIEGRVIDGKIIRFVWKQPASSGRGVWTIGPDRLDGTWGTGDSDSNGGRWDLTKTQLSIAN